MKFAKMFDNRRYGQIVMIRAQNQEGAPEIRFFVQPDGYGVCSFSIGWNDDGAEQKADAAFNALVPREIIEIVDGWMNHMTSSTKELH